MNVKQTTPQAAIDRHIDEYIKAYRNYVIRECTIAGERAVNAARSNHPNNWKDQTGNLRSSIGYVVVLDGNIVAQSSFEVVADGQDGSGKGRSLAIKLADRFPHGIVLIVVAGMDYAVHLANMDYDVVDSAELVAVRLLKKLGVTKAGHL